MERLHGVSETLVIKQTLDVSDGADSEVLVPEVAVGEVHNALGVNGIDLALNLARHHATAGGDDLATNVLSNSSSAVERKKDRSLELSLGTLDLSLADVGAETHPLADGEVNKVVDAGEVVGNKVDTPETI